MSFEDKDLELAILARRFFFSMGFYTELKVPLFVPIYGTQFRRSPASDVDILGVRLDPDFERTVALAEAKSGEEKALDELLKVQAVGEYLKADKRFLVKSRIHENAREIGRHLGVVCLDDPEIRQLLKGLGVDDKSPDTQELLSYRQQKAWLAALRKEKQTQGLANYLESEAWSRPYWENLNNLLYLLKKMLGRSENKLQPPVEFVIFKASGILTLSVLQLCRQILTSSASNIARGVELYIFGGPAERRQKERLRDEVQALAPSLKGLSIAVEPPFLNDLKELVAYLMMSPREATVVPQVFGEAAEILARNSGVFEASNWSGSHKSVTLKLAKDVLQFVLKSCGHKHLGKPLANFLAL